MTIDKIKTTITLCVMLLLGNIGLQANYYAAAGVASAVGYAMLAAHDSRDAGSRYLWVINETEQKFVVSAGVQKPGLIYGNHQLADMFVDVPGSQDPNNAKPVGLNDEYFFDHLPCPSFTYHFRSYRLGAPDSSVFFYNESTENMTEFFISKESGSRDLRTADGITIKARWHRDNDTGLQGWLFVIKKKTKAQIDEENRSYPDLSFAL